MRIQVSNIKTSESTEFNGHEAPILGLSLDPKEEFFVSIKIIVEIFILKIYLFLSF